MSAIISLLKGIYGFFNSLFGSTWGLIIGIASAIASIFLGLPAFLFNLFVWLNIKLFNTSIVDLMALINDTTLAGKSYPYLLLRSSIDFLVYANYFVPMFELSKFFLFLFEFGMIFAFVIFSIKAVFQLVPTGG